MPVIQTKIQPSRRIRVALVDDDASIHAAVRLIFEKQAANWTLEDYLDGRAAVRGIPQTRPDAVLMDISMPEVTGIECTRQIKALLPRLPIIMFTGRSDNESFVASMIAGATGYLIKPAASFDIVSAVSRTLDGLPALSVETQTGILEWLRGLGENMASWDLTPREQQIMLHVCANRDEDEIARLLGISPGTVHGHMMKAFQKLGVHSREEALRKFVGLAGD